MILIMKEKSFEILDIAGESLASFSTDIEYTQIAGNPINDEYYFVALRKDGKLDNFEFRYFFNRRRSNQTAESQKRFIGTINQTFSYEDSPHGDSISVLPYLSRGIKYTLTGTQSGHIK